MSIKTLKNWPQKLLIISPNPFISQSSPDHSPQPRIDFSYYKISGPDICSLICVDQSTARDFTVYLVWYYKPLSKEAVFKFGQPCRMKCISVLARDISFSFSAVFVSWIASWTSTWRFTVQLQKIVQPIVTHQSAGRQGKKSTKMKTYTFNT